MLGMIPFAKAAGRRLGQMFGGKDSKEVLEKEVNDLGLDATGVDIHVDADGQVSVKGEAISQEMKEKIILAVGNVEGVESVKDEADTKDGGAASKFHTVVSGDTLSGISKTYYGTWKHYPKIFEANKPMLSDPDKIYPGQVLRIPSLDSPSA